MLTEVLCLYSRITEVSAIGYKRGHTCWCCAFFIHVI